MFYFIIYITGVAICMLLNIHIGIHEKQEEISEKGEVLGYSLIWPILPLCMIGSMLIVALPIIATKVVDKCSVLTAKKK